MLDDQTLFIESAKGLIVVLGCAHSGVVNTLDYISEVHSHGMNQQEAADLSEDLAADMLGTTLGLEVDTNKAWSEKEQVYKSSGLIIRTSNITQTAKGLKDFWTTSVAIAMLLLD